MTSDGLLRLLLIAESVSLAVMVVAMVAVEVRAGRREVRDGRLRLESYRRVSAALLQPGEETSRLAIRSLRRLRPSVRLRLLADLRHAVAVNNWSDVIALADTAGLIAGARADCASRRWHRRLRGLRTLTILGTGVELAGLHLRDPDSRVRGEAARLVGVTADPDQVVVLTDLLHDPAAGCRFASADVLARLGSSAVPAVVQYLGRPEPHNLALALQVAAAIADPRFLRPVRALARHGDPEVRRSVATVCAAVGGAEAAATLVAHLDDPSPAVRAEAVAGLGRLQHWAEAPAVAARLRDPSFDVRRAAGLALWRLGGPGHVYLRREQRGDDRFAADMARQVLELPLSARAAG